MSTKLTPSGVTFPDNTIQTTAPTLIGVDQIYSTPSRTLGTIYTNNTSKPILVSVVCYGPYNTRVGFNYNLSMYVNGMRVQFFESTPDAANIIRYTVSAIVPIGNTYQVTTSPNSASYTAMTLESWTELS